jgi:hypothetical protein
MTAQQQVAETGHADKDYEIVVNGTLDDVEHQDVTYQQVVNIAFPGQHDPNVTYSVAYRNADEPHGGSGILVAGGSVKVKKKGTSFNVTPSTRS